MLNRARMIFSALVVFCLLFLTAASLPAAETTIVGEVNDSYQIVTDDQIYEIDANDVGDDLIFNHIGEKVAVTGTIRTEDDMKIILVTRFEVVGE